MTIGLPRAMLYYRYGVLWEAFFRELGCDTLTSRETDREIFECGIKYSIDECCLPQKSSWGMSHHSSESATTSVPGSQATAKAGRLRKIQRLYDIAKTPLRI